LEGAGKQATVIRFAPSSAKTLFKFTNGVSPLAQPSVKNMALTGTNSHKKIGIEFIDTIEATIEDVAFNSWTGSVSEAIKLAGREATTLMRVETNADLPLHLSDNPNSTIDVDHLTCYKCYFIVSDSTQPVIKIDSGVNLTNANFLDNAWVRGTHGIYWVDTTTTFQSENLTIRDVRWEQPYDRAGYFLRIEHNYRLRNIIIENARWGAAGAGINGIYFRKAQEITLQNLSYDEGGIALDLNASCSGLALTNVLFSNASVTVMLNGVRGISGSYYIEGSGQLYTFMPASPHSAGSVIQSINPSVTLGFNQFEPASVPVPGNTVIKLGSNALSGMIVMNALTSAVNCIYGINGRHNSVTEMVDAYEQCGNSQGGSNYNFYSIDGEYLFQNNTRTAEAFKFNFFGVGER
jgi:hypothetical protein